MFSEEKCALCHWQPPELALLFSKGHFGGKPVLPPERNELGATAYGLRTGLPLKKRVPVAKPTPAAAKWHTSSFLFFHNRLHTAKLLGRSR